MSQQVYLAKWNERDKKDRGSKIDVKFLEDVDSGTWVCGEMGVE